VAAPDDDTAVQQAGVRDTRKPRRTRKKTDGSDADPQQTAS
jgi:hypothetical protein